MNYSNVYIFLDFETTSKKAHSCQPTQLAAVAICNRKLVVKPNGIFSSLMKPIMDDEKAREAGVDPVTDEVLTLTHLTREELENAPQPKVVVDNFANWLKQFAKTTSGWDQPIFCGFNTDGYDIKILNRLAKEFGYWDEEYQQNKLFHPLHSIDIMKDIYRFTENKKINSNNSISMDSIREWLGISKEMAHDARKDVLDGAFLMIKFLRFYRHASENLIDWEDCFEEANVEIAQIMAKLSK